ncbi:LLM class F420-dependent oxidoreductase [Humibacter ginsenosidimutans]|uniref:LLM class F420-dependent oxidoreductase n=1 Tax=Humibacter ginsenosidimutans TaxID=2599293 RepID=A0A5B8M1A8_9MICO|nr:LLM class F420-dependent oxidoreductase [Humibacter ginsenosidimutans]QDZ14598.1 LLM class F420-dependent oxidoreductase [Humibacter ginsenosidimutans]
MPFNVDQPVSIGVQLAPQHAEYSTIRDTVLRLEDLGVDIVFNWDHFYPLSGDRDGLHFEGWTMLGAWAEQTERIQFGPLVTCNSYRNPDLLADMARTVDHVSAKGGEGRLVFGIGSGWARRDYREYGYEFGSVGSRLDDLAEAMPRIRRRWELLNPAPTRHIPVLIGGGGERKTLRIVAEHADVWHSFSDADELQHKLDVLEGWCERVGRDTSQITISVEPERTQTSAEYEEFRALGARLFTTQISAPDYDWDRVRRLLAWRDAVNG